MDKPLYDINKINKELDKLKIPKEYRNRIVNLERFFTHDITMQLSIRKDAGKTTSALLLGMVLYKLYDGTTTEYVRSDNNMITKQNIMTLYDVIINCGYVERLFKGQYNTIIYKVMEKKFYLAMQSINPDTNESYIEYKSDLPLCHVCANENYVHLKSSYNNTRGNFMVYDEFMDTERSTRTQMIEFENNISTICRARPEAHVLMLGNNVDKYNFWWEEFTVENEIAGLQFGGYIDKRTELGTTFCIEMLQVSEQQKDTIKRKLIRFSGFNTPKMGAFNGIETWQGSSHPHIPYDGLLDNNTPIYNKIWIRCRNRYVRVNIYKDEIFGYFTYLHFSNKPKLDDGIILTDQPMARNETYGLGKHCLNKNVKEYLSVLIDIIGDKRIFYQSNSVGDLVENYFKEVKMNR